MQQSSFPSAWRPAGRQGGPGAVAAAGAGAGLHLILGDLDRHRRQLHHLMHPRRRIAAAGFRGQGLAAAGADFRHADHHLVGGQAAAGAALVTGLTARLAAGGGRGGSLGAQLRGIGRGGPAGVTRVLVEPGRQLLDLGLQLDDERLQFLDLGLERATAGAVRVGCAHTPMESQTGPGVSTP